MQSTKNLSHPPAFEKILNQLDITDAKIDKKNMPRYKRYSLSLKSISTIQQVEGLLTEMLTGELFPNHVIINQCINKLGKLHYFNYVYDLYCIAVKKNIADVITFNSILDVIAKSNEPDVDLALDIFEQAKNQNMLSVVTYNTMLDVIAKSNEPDVDLALDIFEQAKNKNMATNVTYNTMLDVIDF